MNLQASSVNLTHFGLVTAGAVLAGLVVAFLLELVGWWFRR